MTSGVKGYGLDWAFAYVDTVITAECAEQGVDVRIADQGMLAASANLLRVGKLNDNASRIEPRATTPSR
jgi:hypothetical protein